MGRSWRRGTLERPRSAPDPRVGAEDMVIVLVMGRTSVEAVVWPATDCHSRLVAVFAVSRKRSLANPGAVRGVGSSWCSSILVSDHHVSPPPT
jgi:hypothetical protein